LCTSRRGRNTERQGTGFDPQNALEGNTLKVSVELTRQSMTMRKEITKHNLTTQTAPSPLFQAPIPPWLQQYFQHVCEYLPVYHS
jgi:hypothetical protein